MSADPHAGQPVVTAGPPLEEAAAAMVLVHGRGATAQGMLPLARELAHPGFTYLAPQAADSTWYPQRFMAPLEANEPYLTSALAAVWRVVEEIAVAGVPAERTILLGFSQGACLTLELVVRHARRYGAVVGLTGGLPGPPGRDFDFEGDFAGTPVLLAAGDPDPHVPWHRVEETAGVLRDLGAEVTLERYPGMGHTVNEEELQLTRALMERAAATPAESGE